MSKLVKDFIPIYLFETYSPSSHLLPFINWTVKFLDSTSGLDSITRHPGIRSENWRDQEWKK